LTGLALLLLACTGAPPKDDATTESARDLEPPLPLPVLSTQRVTAADLGLSTSRAVGFAGPGIALADLDGDDALDLAWVSARGWGRWLRNDGNGTFIDAGELPAWGNGVTAVDLDDDGDQDLIVVGPEADALLRNDGAGAFTVETIEPPSPVTEGSGASLADLDDDGDVDVVVATYAHALNGQVVLEDGGTGDGNVVYWNDGGTLRRDASAIPWPAATGLTFHLALFDADLDGDADAYAVNDFGPTALPNRLLRNDGGAFTDVSDTCGCGVAMFAMGAAVGDPDADGDPDLFLTNLGPPKFLANDGTGRFYDAGAATGLVIPDDAVHDTSWSARFVDVDMDGAEDLTVTFGQLDAPGTVMAEWLAENADVVFENAAEQPDVLLLNRGDDGFEDVSAAVGFDDPSVTKTLAVGDVDGDARPDLVTAGLDFVAIHRVDAGPARGLAVRLAGPPGNPAGIGARVEVEVGGATLRRWMLPASQGSFGSDAAEVYAGLGRAGHADTLTVHWPDGAVTRLEDVPAGRVVVQAGESVRRPDRSPTRPAAPARAPAHLP
jgi:hypothetical protein